mmetsp:Transcript_16590/g.26507  ORF Transcript_16590/g.26507 Transcript_16590/m.26507 type:complete len:202 (-) Transcript_16590:110-715(-)
MHELEHNRAQMLMELKGIHHLMTNEERAFGGVELDGSGVALQDLHQRVEEFNQKCKDWNLVRPIPHLWLKPIRLMKELDVISRQPQSVTAEYSKYSHLVIERMRKAKIRRENRDGGSTTSPQASSILDAAMWRLMSDEAAANDDEDPSYFEDIRPEGGSTDGRKHKKSRSERRLVLLAATPGIACMIGCFAVILERGGLAF